MCKVLCGHIPTIVCKYVCRLMHTGTCISVIICDMYEVLTHHTGCKGWRVNAQLT